MKVRLNGNLEDVGEGATLDLLVDRLGLPRDVIAIELNRAVVRRERYASVWLAEGDEVEIVTLVGGG